MNLVLHEVNQFQHVDVANGDRTVERLACPPVVEGGLADDRRGHVQHTGDLQSVRVQLTRPDAGEGERVAGRLLVVVCHVLEPDLEADIGGGAVARVAEHGVGVETARGDPGAGCRPVWLGAERRIARQGAHGVGPLDEPGARQRVADVLVVGPVEHRGDGAEVQLVRGQTQVSLEHLTQVHARWDAYGIQDDVDGCAVR